MRTKEFFTRLGVLVPLAFWTVFMFMMILGILANAMGVFSGLYCDVYCKLGIGLFSVALLSIVYCQARSCQK